jgi:hypothetical protein
MGTSMLGSQAARKMFQVGSELLLCTRWPVSNSFGAAGNGLLGVAGSALGLIG